MGIIVEIAGMVGEMLAEYASSKRWGKLKTFFVSSGCFFSLFTIYILLFPSDKGLYIGILTAICLALTLGVCVIGLMYYHEKHKA